MKYYLIHVAGLIEPNLLGAWNDRDARANFALHYHNESDNYDSEDDALFWLDIGMDGTPSIGAYPAGFFYVTCKFCGKEIYPLDAHKHDTGYVGDCCWNERLRITE